jgi:UDPglucose 6-dehydrogenase
VTGDLLYANSRANSYKRFEALECANSTPTCLSGVHCCVVVTEWEQFKALTPDDFIEHMAQPVVVNARRIFDPRQFRHRLEFSAVALDNGR